MEPLSVVLEKIMNISISMFVELPLEARAKLEANFNTCNDWSRILGLTSRSFDSKSLERIRQCNFCITGKDDFILLGDFSDHLITLQDDIILPCGLYDSTFSGQCILNDYCLVRNTLFIKNTFLGEFGSIFGCGKVFCDGKTSLFLSL